MRDYKLYIEDINNSILKIISYTEGLTKEGFRDDPKTYDSVLHNLMIIGEAAARIPEEVCDKNQQINWSGIIGMRNIIAHGYFIIDSDIIWVTVKERIPELYEQIKTLL